MKLVSLFIVCAYLGQSFAADYTNYKVYDVTPSKETMAELMQWQFKAGVDFLEVHAEEHSRILISPEVEQPFTDFLKRSNMPHELLIDNIEPELQREKQQRLAKRGKRSVLDEENEPNFELFWTFEEMESFSIQLAQQYPNLVTRDVIGKSIEGRNLFGLRVSTGTQFGKKPIIFIDAGTHAREWAGHHAVLYLLNQLVTNATVRTELVDKVDWVIVPVVNPDGYVYSYTEERLWRKNRRVVNATCTGVDLNRNFAYVWKYTPNSCTSQSHSGAAPLSEPEIAALTTYMESFKYNLRLYLSTHTYGNYVLWPFGFDFNVYVKNWKEHELVGQRFVDAIRNATGTSYRLGNSADILYTANGASDDHAVAYANANLAFTLELTGGGANGFDFPQDRINDLVKETFLGYREFGLYIGETYNYE